MRKVATFVLGLGSALAALVSAAVAQPVCRGTDMLPALAKDQPAAHARILDFAKSESNGEALLWRIAAPAAQTASVAVKDSWLLGTIHLTDPRVTTLSPAVAQALDSVKTLALEIDNIDDKSMAKAIGQNAALIGLSGGRRLDRLLPGGDLPALQGAFKALGLPANEAVLLRPWFLTTMLSRPACEMKRQEAGLQPLDTALRTRVLKRKARVVGLETIADQLKAMASLPLETEVAWLRAAIALYPQIEDHTETLMQLYLKRQIGATWELSQALAGSLAMTPAQLAHVQDALVVRRNHKMRDAALPLLAKGDVFIGVGALHLPGRDGLVQLLRDKGYTVTAVE